MNEKNITEARYTLGALLRRPYDALVHEVYEGLAQDGWGAIRPAHGPILRHIAPDGSRTVDLARAAGIAKQSMAYLVSDLETSGFAETIADPSDGRARLVKLTAKGQEVQEEIVRRSAMVEARWAKDLGEERWQAARDTLRALFDSLEGSVSKDNLR